MRILYQGGEATIYTDDHVVVKRRLRKSYRHPTLDETLRQQRTKTEASILRKLHSKGVRVPSVIDVTSDTITMEAIDGQAVRDVLTEDNFHHICENIGRVLSQIHDQQVSHGDVTTSNLLLSKNTIYAIDFGLAQHSRRIEDYAVDLHILFQSFAAHHPSLYIQCKQAVLSTYTHQEVKDRLLVVEQRGKNKTKH